jgi:hypothetical protein
MKSCASECVELGLKRPYLLPIAPIKVIRRPPSPDGVVAILLSVLMNSGILRTSFLTPSHIYLSDHKHNLSTQ